MAKVKIILILMLFGIAVLGGEIENKNMELLYNSGIGNVEMVAEYLKKGADIEAKSIREGRTPLMNAAEHGNINVVKLLCDKGAQIDAKDYNGNNLLMIAINGTFDLETIEYLIAKGVKIEETNNKNENILEAVYKYGTKEGNDRLVLELAKLMEAKGISPYYLAICFNNDGFFDLLMNNKMDTAKPDRNNSTPLIYAVRGGKTKEVKKILSSGGNKTYLDKDNRGALIYAVINGRTEIVKMLLDLGVDVNTKDKNGSTPIEYSISNNDLEITRHLLNYGAEVTPKLAANAKSKNTELYSVIRKYE